MGAKISKGGDIAESNVGDCDLSPKLQLGEHALSLAKDGRWTMTSKTSESYKKHLTGLEETITSLETRLEEAYEELNKKAETERVSRQPPEKAVREAAKYKRKCVKQEKQIDELKFRNKVLIAMCTLSEGDYTAICKEAGLEVRGMKLRRARGDEQARV